MNDSVKADEEQKKAKFKVDSRLITQILGSEIIESHSIAFAEQIKNSKDANAAEVKIDFSNMKNDEIIIEDNGCGMSEKEVEKDWFLLGNSEKEGKAEFSGGKGIGRLSLFKIGKKFEVRTSNGEFTTTFSISEDELTKGEADSFETDLYTKREIGPSGTKITINGLDSEISLEEIEIELNNLLSDKNKLNLKIEYPSSFNETTFLTEKEIADIVPFSATIDIDFDKFEETTDIKYSFSAKLEKKEVYKNENFLRKFEDPIQELINRKGNNLDIGKLHFELKNFFFENKKAKYFPRSVNNKSIKNYFLRVHQGINIYRNQFKIYGHGSEDWLKLAENRVSKPGENIDNKLTYGIITLDDDKSGQLKEKSNREGFIRNGTNKLFRELMLIIVKQFGKDRQESVKRIKSEITQLENKAEEEHKEQSKAKNNDNTNSINDSGNMTENEKKILKVTEHCIEQGDSILLKKSQFVNKEFIDDVKLEYFGGLIIENDMVSSKNKPGSYEVNYVYGENSEKLCLTIRKRDVIRGRKEDDFFENTKQFNGEIDLSNINDLVDQLNGLNYDEKCLLYNISFRAIIESEVKKYIVRRPNLKLGKSLKENVETTVEDLLQVLHINKKSDPYRNQKQKIHEKFLGWSALKNFLSSLELKFGEKNYDQLLHSLTHNPTRVDKDLALEVANEMIVPLHVLIRMLIEKNII